MQKTIRPVFKSTSSQQEKEQLRVGLLWSFSLFVIVIISLFLIYKNIQVNIRKEMDREQIIELHSMNDHVDNLFSRLEGYLIHIPRLSAIVKVFLTDDRQVREEAERLLAEIVRLNVNRFAPTFDQLRLIDLNGFEKVRVDLGKNNKTKICPVGQLQDKSGRYYFQQSVNLKENKIYMSQLDLNVEQGEIEIPHKPMIRFVAPVFGSDGKRLGFFVINYLVQQVFDYFDDMNKHEGDQWTLLNEDGYYLGSSDPGKDLGFMYPDKQMGFFADYPDFWQKLSKIGRASCRERVLRVVYISVVAVYRKKKKNKIIKPIM